MSRRSTVDLEEVHGVTVIRVSSGKVNAMDVDLLDELADAVSELGAAEPDRPLVVTGAGRTFSAGVDLELLLEGGPEYVDRLIPALVRAFVTVFSYPGPTVAAINGAAIAGGCVLACACDLRILHGEAPIGATELTVGIPFPAGALEIIRHACGGAAPTVILSGRLFRGEAALAVGLAHEVTSADVVSRAIEAAGALPAGVAYRLAKAQLQGAVVDRIGVTSDEAVRDEWSSPQAVARIRAHLERLKQRRS